MQQRQLLQTEELGWRKCSAERNSLPRAVARVLPHFVRESVSSSRSEEVDAAASAAADGGVRLAYAPCRDELPPPRFRAGTCMFKKPESVEAERVFGRGGRPFRMGDRGRLVL